MKYIIFGFFLLVSFQSYGQQEPSFSLYSQFMGIYNPSSIPEEYTYNEHNLIFGTNERWQWTNLASAPKTQSLHAEFITKTNNTFNLLVGGHILNDKAGPISTTSFNVRIAGIMSDYDPVYGGISAGLQIGAIQYRVNTTSLQKKYSSDFLTLENTQVTRPQLSLGISYYNSFRHGFLRGIHINTGLSISHLGVNDLEFKDDLTTFNFQSNLHYYGYGVFRKTFGNDQAIELNTWVRFVENAPLNADFHLRFDINSIFSIETGANTSGIGHIGFGVKLLDLFGSNNLIYLKYGYNPSVLKAGSLFGNTHEIGLNYSLER